MTGREGTVVGPYRLTRLLGSGGAGEVYLADGPAYGEQPGIAAVKVLRGVATDPTAAAMLQQTQALARLHQPHVLPIYRADQQGATVYIAMTYAAGGSLGATIGGASERRVRLPLGAGVVARLVNQVARALQALHERGTVHGDIKPNNLFVRTTRQGGPMVAVADFGQSVVIRAAAQAAVTNKSWAAAALQCAAPEQLRGEDVPASDQYALATIAYLLLTGRFPFAGGAAALSEAIRSTPPMPPSRLDPALSTGAEAALLRALAKTPSARFPDVATFAQALDDGLAASRSALTGVTQEFSALGGGALGAALPDRTSAPQPTGAAQPPYAGDARARAQGQVHSTAMPQRARPTGAPHTGDVGVSAPQGRGGLSPRQRTAAVVGGVLVLALALAGGFGLTMLLKGPIAQGTLPNFSGLNYAPTTTPNAAALAKAAAIAHAAEAQLAAVTATKPVFTDSLTSNSQHWPVDNKSSFFAADGELHLYNHDVRSVLSLDQPGSVPDAFAVSVSLTFLHGSISDLAGLRVRVTPAGDGQFAHVTVLISPDGRYEIWSYSGSRWTVLDFGYTQTITRGFNQTNTLAVLAMGGAIHVFINSHYISTVADPGAATAGSNAMGPTVVYAGTEVAYAHYAVYAAGS